MFLKISVASSLTVSVCVFVLISIVFFLSAVESITKHTIVVTLILKHHARKTDVFMPDCKKQQTLFI